MIILFTHDKESEQHVRHCEPTIHQHKLSVYTVHLLAAFHLDFENIPTLRR